MDLALVFGTRSPPSPATLVTSAPMKPFAGLVRLRQGTVNLKLVGGLCRGSVPSAFAGVSARRPRRRSAGEDVVVTT